MLYINFHQLFSLVPNFQVIDLNFDSGDWEEPPKVPKDAAEGSLILQKYLHLKEKESGKLVHPVLDIATMLQQN